MSERIENLFQCENCGDLRRRRETMTPEERKEFEEHIFTHNTRIGSYDGCSVKFAIRMRQKLLAEIDRLEADNQRLNTYVNDSGTTCFSCEVCGHSRTVKLCVWCENKQLKALNEGGVEVEIERGTNIHRWLYLNIPSFDRCRLPKELCPELKPGYSRPAKIILLQKEEK